MKELISSWIETEAVFVLRDDAVFPCESLVQIILAFFVNAPITIIYETIFMFFFEP